MRFCPFTLQAISAVRDRVTRIIFEKSCPFHQLTEKACMFYNGLSSLLLGSYYSCLNNNAPSQGGFFSIAYRNYLPKTILGKSGQKYFSSLTQGWVKSIFVACNSLKLNKIISLLSKIISVKKYLPRRNTQAKPFAPSMHRPTLPDVP